MVNHQPVQTALLRNGDVITLGSVKLRFWLAAAQQRGLRLREGFVWALLAAVIFNQWLRHAPCKGASRGTQFAALAMLALLLFPVISVTDDLIAAQNPAEPDCCQRRVHVTPSGHSTYPAVAALPPPVVADLSFGFLRFVAPGQVSAPFVANPAFAAIQNRPPPAA